MKPADYPIADVVPHAGTMSLLAAIDDGGDDWLQARASIDPDNLFVTADGVPSWVGIEYMAQTVAAWAGVQARRRGELPHIGFLVGTRRYEVDTPLFPLGCQLQIHVQQLLAGDNGLGAFECSLQAFAADGARYSARATLNVFQPDNVDEILGEAP